MGDAANNASRLTRDFNDVRKKLTDICSIINITFFHLLRNLIHLLFDNYYVSVMNSRISYLSIVYKQQLSRFTISARCASEIILRIKPQEILEKTPLGV